MIAVKNEGIMLEPTGLSFESKAVLNPACIEVDGTVHLFYRAIGKKNISSIGGCQLEGNKVIKRLTHPVLFPEYDYEKQGLEDPRITLLDQTFYLLYTAFDGQNVRIAYATSNDLVNFTKKGLVSPNITYNEACEIFRQVGLKEEYFVRKLYPKRQIKSVSLLWEKDAVLFPKKINNQFALIHRIRPDMQIIYFRNFIDLTDDYWRTYLKDLKKYVVLEPKFWFENKYIGGGCPPIETRDGWLIIYHAVENTPYGKIYHASAALLDLKNPLKVLGRLQEPLFSPKAPWEKSGITDNVVFPTGAVARDKRLYIYYGAADKLIAARSVDLAELLTELEKNS